MDYCQNCGHICHCDKDCEQDYGKNEKIVCCSTCRHIEEEEKPSSPEDLFNGA